MSSILGGGGGGGSSGITINTTTITGGTTGDVLYDNAGTVGEAADFTISSGQPNVLAGFQYLYDGVNFGYLMQSIKSMYLGKAAGNNFNDSGGQNIGLGPTALGSITVGANNCAVGFEAGRLIASGNRNVCLGIQSGWSLTSGGDNMCVGESAHATNATGSFNVAIGTNSMSNTGDGCASNIAIGDSTMRLGGAGAFNNVAIGRGALQNPTGNYTFNTAIGFLAMQNYGGASDSNIAIGAQCLRSLTGGGGNTWIGSFIDTATTISNTIALGCGRPSAAIFLDYNFTNALKWTMAGNLIIPALSTAGILVNDASGNVISDSTVAAATVAANFTADHRLQVSIAGTTYFIAMSTTAW